MAVQVYINAVYQSAPCRHGTRAVTILATGLPVFEGDGQACSNFLRGSVGVGESVAVRHSGGLRSCMNKPALWDDVESYA